jgi:hypothetical protein
MKVTRKKEIPVFQPFTIEVTFETESELEKLQACLGQVPHSSALYRTLDELLKGETW